MKQNKEVKPLSGWIFILILFLFALLGTAIWFQYENIIEIFYFNDAISYLFVGVIFLFIIFLIVFLVLAAKSRLSYKLFSKKYFSVEFTEKRHLKSLDEKYVSLLVDDYENSDKNFQPIVKSETRVETKESALGKPTTNDQTLKTESTRFYMLSQIDKDMENYVAPNYDLTVTLSDICESFRNFSSNKLKLYYDIEDIRRFIGGLSVTKMIILQGMSGTGKTSLAYAFGEYLKNTTVVVPIQPMWKERTDLIGYYNEFTKKFNETTLLYKMYEANYNDEIYITVLDEMNIARVEYYFAEFLSLLELPNPEGRNLDVVSDKWDSDPKLLKKGQIRLPTNMWFVGTINNDDSTFAISDKVYDRAMVLNLDKKAKPFEAPETQCPKISAEHLQDLFTKAQKEYSISDRNLRRISALDKYMIQNFKLTFGNRIMKQIKSYVPVIVACGGTELQALDDIMSTKVFRKLEAKNPVYVRQMADSVCAYLDELFGIDKMPLCKEAIRLIEQNI